MFLTVAGIDMITIGFQEVKILDLIQVTCNLQPVIRNIIYLWFPIRLLHPPHTMQQIVREQYLVVIY